MTTISSSICCGLTNRLVGRRYFNNGILTTDGELPGVPPLILALEQAKHQRGVLFKNDIKTN